MGGDGSRFFVKKLFTHCLSHFPLSFFCPLKTRRRESEKRAGGRGEKAIGIIYESECEEEEEHEEGKASWCVCVFVWGKTSDFCGVFLKKVGVVLFLAKKRWEG